jgi:uncharacterized protein with FMN-binding domain
MDNNEIKPAHKAARAILLAVVLTGAVIVVALVAGYIGFEVMGRQAENAVGDFKPDTAALYDGVYSGEYIAFDAFTAAEVEFDIENGRLSAIEFSRLLQTPGHDASEEVRGRISESGDLRFDTVTGATRTSGFAKAAIKDAIETGPIGEFEGLSGIDFR